MVRTYRPEDLETLRKITVICFDGISIDQNIETAFGRFADTIWQERKASHIDNDAEGHSEGLFVYEVDKEVIGYITTRIDRHTRVGGIPNMAVLPGHQGKGIGKALMKAALDHLEEQGMVIARIETLDNNDVGIQFYPRTGFVEVARQIHYAMPLKDRKL